MTWAVYYTYHGNFHWNLFSIAFGLLWLCKVQHVLLNLKVTRKVILNLWCLWNLYFHRVCSCVIYMFFSLAYHFNVWLTIPDKNFTVDLLNSTSDEYWQTETEVMNKVRHHQLVFKIHLLRVSCRNKIFFSFFFSHNQFRISHQKCVRTDLINSFTHCFSMYQKLNEWAGERKISAWWKSKKCVNKTLQTRTP